MPRNRPVTRDDVLTIAGQLDDRQIAEVVATKATVAELMEARQRVLSNDTPDIHRQPSPRVNHLAEILNSAQPDEE